MMNNIDLVRVICIIGEVPQPDTSKLYEVIITNFSRDLSPVKADGLITTRASEEEIIFNMNHNILVYRAEMVTINKELYLAPQVKCHNNGGHLQTNPNDTTDDNLGNMQ